MCAIRIGLQVVAGALLGAAIYFLFWPVPVEPLAWDAPADRGFVDPYAPNEQLKFAQAIDLGEYAGPEDITAGKDGLLYSTSESGAILRYYPDGRVEVFAEAGGRPLGIEVDRDGSLVIANAYLGLQRVLPDGTVRLLLDEVDGRPLVYADDLDIADDGRIFFSEASNRFGAQANGGTYAASLLDIMEHGGNGFVAEFDPASGTARIIIDDLNFANGIAISKDQRFLLVAETGAYRILKHWLSGPDAGKTEVLLDNLPAFPDNINRGLQDRFWIGLISPRVAILDRLAGNPFLRKVVQRMPTRLRPGAVPHSQVIAINGDGEVLMNLHDERARFPALTGVFETRDTLFLTTLFGHRLAYVRKQDL